MSNTIEKEARSFCERNGGRVEEKISDDKRKYLVCVFESALVYDSGAVFDDSHEYDLFSYYNGEVEKDDEIHQSKEEICSLGSDVVDSVNNNAQPKENFVYKLWILCRF